MSQYNMRVERRYNTSISVVTPSLNQAVFLPDALDSVIVQGPQEYIVIDGKSSDLSLEVINARTNNITYWSSEVDRGQSDAINKGFALCTSKWICWINSDDMLCEYALEAIRPHLYTDKQWIVTTAINMVDDALREEPLPARISLEDLLLNKVRLSQPGVLMRRTAFEKIGGLNTDLNYAMDYDLWIRLYLAFGEPLSVNVRYGVARWHGGSKTGTRWHAYVSECYDVVTVLMPHLPSSLRRRVAKYWRSHAVNSRLNYAVDLLSSKGSIFAIWRIVCAVYSYPKAIFRRNAWSAIIACIRRQTRAIDLQMQL